MDVDVARSRDQIFFEGPERGRRLSRFRMLLLLAAGDQLAPDRRDDVRQQDVQAVAQHWADKAGWAVVAVSASGEQILIPGEGPRPRAQHRGPPAGPRRRRPDSVPAQVSLAPETYEPVPAAG